MSNEVRQQVLGGMELISWKTEVVTEHRTLAIERRPERIDRRLLVGNAYLFALVAFAGVAVRAVGWAGVEAAAALALLSGGAVGATVLYGVPALSRLKARFSKKLAVEPDVQVVLTSTGLVFGDVARLWKGQDRQLAWVRFANQVRGQLLLGFRRRGWLHWLAQETVAIPVPSRLRRDMPEIVESLSNLHQPASPNPETMSHRR